MIETVGIVKGTLLKHSMSRGFIYAYQCSLCGHQFLQANTPDLSIPVLCHGCYTGKYNREAKRRRSNR